MPQTPLPLVDASAFVIISSAFSAMLYWVMRTLQGTIVQLNRTINANTLTLTALMQIVIRHDAQVRGLNPTAGATAEERNEEAIHIYTELRNEISALRQQLIQMEKVS